MVVPIGQLCQRSPMGTTINSPTRSLSGRMMVTTEIVPFLMERVSPRFTTSLSLISRITVSNASIFKGYFTCINWKNGCSYGKVENILSKQNIFFYL